MTRLPLSGLNVLEIAGGVAGPYAGRILATLGATVVKVEAHGGDPARRLAVDDGPVPTPSPAYVHLNAGKRNVSHAAYESRRTAAMEWADVVIDDRVKADVELGEGLSSTGVHVSITAWGYDADEPGTPADELLVQAASGVTTMTTDPDHGPLRLPGWQSQYLAGAYGAAAALVALRNGRPHHVDVSWLAAMASGCEGSFQVHLSTGYEAPPAGPVMTQAFPGGAFRCKDGHVVVGTVRRTDWERQCAIYGTPELALDERFATREARTKNWRELADIIQPWYDAHTKQEIFELGLDAGWAVGMVMSPLDALGDRHLAEREFLATVETPGGPCRIPRAPLRIAQLPLSSTLSVADTGEDDEWFSALGTPAPPARAKAGGVAPLAGVRILELTTAWAGPFVGRFLGAFGADVVKVESGNAFDIWRGPMPYRMFGVSPPDGAQATDLSHDISPNFTALNRNKRGASIDLSAPAGRDAFLRLVAEADVLVVNMTHRVLPSLGLDEEVLRQARHDLIVLNMPALGATGPYRSAAGYGSIMEGMGGLACRFGTEDEGARVSQTYYPDPVAGIHGVVAVLAGLAHRDDTGDGLTLDLSQQETVWCQLGETIAHASLTGRNPDRTGNREPGVPSGIEADGNAWTARVGDQHERVLRYSGAKADERLRWCIEELDHPVTGTRPLLRLPVRIDGDPVTSVRRAPLLGEHTAEVLEDWAGYDADEVERLCSLGVADAPPRMEATV